MNQDYPNDHRIDNLDTIETMLLNPLKKDRLTENLGHIHVE
ncbi:unnamed protein product [Schistosoma mattheei]|uniref:Uncharacterized protein n=1 Tax=Schistosoma mattheei TaxID=31246 RepID=A0A183NKG6_9TREM|nr:unnamed protein product [Schistosoma mattheei]